MQAARRLRMGVLAADAITLLARIVGRDPVRAESQATAELARLCGFLPLALRIAAAHLAGNADTIAVRDAPARDFMAWPGGCAPCRGTAQPRHGVVAAGQRIEEAGPDASVRIVPGEAGRMRLSVEKLEALGEPPAQHPGVPAPAGPQDLPRTAR